MGPEVATRKAKAKANLIKQKKTVSKLRKEVRGEASMLTEFDETCRHLLFMSPYAVLNAVVALCVDTLAFIAWADLEDQENRRVDPAVAKGQGSQA
eukprot:SAG31_NODE_3538_length_4145_cov_1.703658_7_plen_96_part_00